MHARLAGAPPQRRRRVLVRPSSGGSGERGASTSTGRVSPPLLSFPYQSSKSFSPFYPSPPLPLLQPPTTTRNGISEVKPQTVASSTTPFTNSFSLQQSCKVTSGSEYGRQHRMAHLTEGDVADEENALRRLNIATQKESLSSACATLEPQLRETLTAIRQRQKSLVLFEKSNLPEKIKAEYAASQAELLEEDLFWQTEIVNRLREKADERVGLEVRSCHGVRRHNVFSFSVFWHPVFRSLSDAASTLFFSSSPLLLFSSSPLLLFSSSPVLLFSSSSRQLLYSVSRDLLFSL